MERFSHEGWRATKYASTSNRVLCAGKTKSGEQCYANVGYGALADSEEHPSDFAGKPATVFYCHRHASDVLNAEQNARRAANGFS